MHWIEQAPLALIGVAFMAALLLAYALAVRVGRRPGLKQGGGEALGYLVSSALGLLGLLMAFTFSAAQEKFRLRQDLVVSEANAIGTSYLRVQMLSSPWREELSRELLRYAETRERFINASNLAQLAATSENSAAVQDAIWRDLSQALKSDPAPALDLALMLTINDMFDQGAASRAARETHVPNAILRSLLFYSVVAAFLLGLTDSRGERRWTAVLIGVLLLLTLAYCLILDLDRPVSGTVRVSAAPIHRALADIQQSEAAKRVAGQAASAPLSGPSRSP